METIESIDDWRAIRKQASMEELGFIPTMGALHNGHLALIRRARKENTCIVASLFVNPTQFNDSEDLKRYPRNLPQDMALLEQEAVDYVFIPQPEEMYSDQYRFKVVETELSRKLCGKDRPGHFDGVLTVVLKLFNIIAPRRAYFGEKDFQQLMLVKDMVAYLFLPVHIVAVPIVRDEDGVALSSRNALLSLEERKLATLFARYLRESSSPEEAQHLLKANGMEVDYVTEWNNRRLGAVKIGGVRLIDNVPIN